MFWTIVGALVFVFIVLPFLWQIFTGTIEFTHDMYVDEKDKKAKKVLDKIPAHIEKPTELVQSGSTRPKTIQNEFVQPELARPKKMRSFRLEL